MPVSAVSLVEHGGTVRVSFAVAVVVAEPPSTNSSSNLDPPLVSQH